MYLFCSLTIYLNCVSHHVVPLWLLIVIIHDYFPFFFFIIILYSFYILYFLIFHPYHVILTNLNATYLHCFFHEIQLISIFRIKLCYNNSIYIFNECLLLIFSLCFLNVLSHNVYLLSFLASISQYIISINVFITFHDHYVFLSLSFSSSFTIFSFCNFILGFHYILIFVSSLFTFCVFNIHLNCIFSLFLLKIFFIMLDIIAILYFYLFFILLSHQIY